jgi:CHAT domain-containing protein
LKRSVSATGIPPIGKFYLAEKRFDQAIEQFESVLKETPQDAAAENDVGAALFEFSKLEAFRNQAAESMRHQAESFEHFSRALELRPGYLEALFNLALCKERMLLRDQAAEDWGRYLQLDSTSKWADEARQHLEQIQKTGQRHKYDPEIWYGDFRSACERGDDDRAFELISDSYQSAGNLITERLINEYLAAKEKLDDAVSEKRLQCLDYAARLTYQRAHESYFTELARYYRRSSSQQRFLTREARRQTQEAIILSRNGNKKDAAEKLIAVEQQYHRAGNDSESVFARYLRGTIVLRLGDFEECKAIFQPMSQSSNSFLWLRGQALSALSDLYERLGMLSGALQSAHLAVGIADQLQDTNFRLKSLNQVATYWYLLGDWRKSLAYLGRAREIAAVKPSASIDLWAIEHTSALVCSGLQFLRAAEALQLQAVKTAEEMRRELQISRSYTNLGVILGLQGDFASAIRVTKRGYDLGARYSTPQDARVITDYTGLQLAHLQRKSGDNEAAVETYSEILSRIQDEAQPVYQFDAYRGKALAEIAQGKRAEAQQDLDAALQIFERNRQAIWDENARNRFFDREYEIYDAAINLAYASNPQRAFEYSERSRAKSLRESLGATPARHYLPRTLPAIQHALPADVILLQYAALPDQLLIWGATHKHFVSASIPIRAAELEQQVIQFFRAISRPNTSVEQYRPLAQALSRLLMEPLGSFIAEGATLVIIPDKFLNYVPFSALISPRTGQYLVERHPTILAPSATVFLQCAENAARRTPAQSERLLAIGNPSFDTNAYPSLENLTNAVREANEIAAFYPNKHVLLGAQADERTAVAEIGNADVIHLALHGVKDPLSPLNSFLLFARPEGRAPEDGRLQAHEIGWIKSARARLAVLSACQSGVETYYRGEGMIGLSRSFLSIGVPTVVASFWSVDSSATANLMITFHRVMRLDRLSPAKALQQAQMTLAKGNQSLYQAPYYWAGFCVFGGESTPSITIRGANHACIDDHQHTSSGG